MRRAVHRLIFHPKIVRVWLQKPSVLILFITFFRINYAAHRYQIKKDLQKRIIEFLLYDGRSDLRHLTDSSWTVIEKVVKRKFYIFVSFIFSSTLCTICVGCVCTMFWATCLRELLIWRIIEWFRECLWTIPPKCSQDLLRKFPFSYHFSSSNGRNSSF